MIELEIQVLSEKRDGLLIEIGRAVTAGGFTLQRQRLTQDVNGVLLSMVVRGSARQQRALESVLESHERVISFEVSEFVDGELKPHFAAARKINWKPALVPAPALVALTPADMPVVAKASAHVAAQAVAAVTALPPAAVAAKATAPVVALKVEPVAVPVSAQVSQPAAADFEFILPEPPRRAAAAPEPEKPFVDLVPLGPDVEAVDKALRSLELNYPHIVPQLLTLDRAVAAGARESSLSLAGQRAGAWVFQRDFAASVSADLHQAIESIGVPALSGLVDVVQKGDQLHIRNSPLCAEHDHSGCGFFSGYLEGVLGPAVGSDHLSIFPVCCRSFGADACVLAISA